MKTYKTPKTLEKKNFIALNCNKKTANNTKLKTKEISKVKILSLIIVLVLTIILISLSTESLGIEETTDDTYETQEDANSETTQITFTDENLYQAIIQALTDKIEEKK